MTKPSLLAAAALGLTLAACDSRGEPTETTNIVVPKGDYAEEIANLEPGQRDAVFLRAIRDAGRDCQGVESSSTQGNVDGNPAWTAVCVDGSQWVIILGRDGIAQVASVAELQAAAARR